MRIEQLDSIATRDGGAADPRLVKDNALDVEMSKSPRVFSQKRQFCALQKKSIFLFTLQHRPDKFFPWALGVILQIAGLFDSFGEKPPHIRYGSKERGGRCG